MTGDWFTLPGDWFTALLGEVGTELTASPDTQVKLARVQRVTRDELASAMMSMEQELRVQLAQGIDEVAQADLLMLQAAYEALPEGRRLDEASYLYTELWRIYSEFESSWSGTRRGRRADPRGRRADPRGRRATAPRYARSLRVYRVVPRGLKLRARPSAWFMLTQRPRLQLESLRALVMLRPRSVIRSRKVVAEADASLKRAMEDLQTATTSNQARHIKDLRIARQLRSEELQKLRKALWSALTLKVNEIVDIALEDSYARDFSYVGVPWLPDTLASAGEEPVSTKAYQQARFLIDNVGSGSVGVAGPRGSGKSTLLNQFARTQHAGAARQWGVCVSAPTKYDPREFLLHLFGRLCGAVMGGDRQATALEERITAVSPAAVASGGLTPVFWFATLAAIACFGIVTGLLTARPVKSPHEMTDLLIASCCAACGLTGALASLLLLSLKGRQFMATPMAARTPVLIAIPCSAAAVALFALILTGAAPEPGYLAAGLAGVALITIWTLPSLWRNPRPMGRSHLRLPAGPPKQSAMDWYRKVKFQQSYTTGWSGTVTVGASAVPVQLQAGLSGSTAVIPFAMSTPEIVDAFRSFTDELARDRDAEAPRVPVVIGIDEVDKIEDPQEAQAFFNQIKGLFGASNCLFLISISDDAMAAFERRGMPLRDAFDSSLSAVISLSYLSRVEARRLIGSRLVGIQEPAADLLFTLSGGLPRELVRLIRRATEARAAAEAASWDTCPLDYLAVTLAAAEIQAQQRAVLAAVRSLTPCAGKEKLLEWAAASLPADHAPAADPAGPVAQRYFKELLADAERLLTACPRPASPSDVTAAPSGGGGLNGSTTTQHADTCLARETGALLFWLATVGQTFLECKTREDFEQAETGYVDRDRTFHHLATARQNFPLGPDYVLAVSTATRKAWNLA